MSENHPSDRQRDSSKHLLANPNSAENIIYSSDMKEDEYIDEIETNPVSVLNPNESEYDEELSTRMRSNSFERKRKKQSKGPHYQPSAHSNKGQLNRNLNIKQQQVYQQQQQQTYYYQSEANDDLDYYNDDNEDFNEDYDEENRSIQQPLNRINIPLAKQTASKNLLRSDSHQNKPVLMSSPSNLNIQTRQTTSHTHHHQKNVQNYSSPTKHLNTNMGPKPLNLSMNHHAFGYEVDPKDDKIDLWGHLLIGLSYFFLVFSFPFSLCACVKVAQEYERAVIFRLGRILAGGAKGPGIFFVLPCIDTYIKVDLRTVTFDVPPQEILTRDSVTVSVDAVVYFRIFNAVISVINVEDAAKSTKLLAASTLRNILGTKSLHEILSDRESVAILIQNNLDDATGPWGVKVERVEVKDVRLPVQLQRAMATEAEAAREARAKVIAAEGEQKASKALKEAAEVISESPIAIQLRYLQTLTQIASERNSTIVFPIPLEMLSFLANKSATVFKSKS